MPVSTTINAIAYDGNDVTTAFPVPFPFFATSDLVVRERVVATGTVSVKALGADYTVSGGSGSTGTVTAVTPPASTVTWTITRATAKTQAIDFTDNDPFPAESAERGLDRLTLIVQDMAADVQRSVRFPTADPSGLTAETPISTLRAGRLLGFDINGNVVTPSTFGQWRNAWAASTDYVIGDAVTRSDTLDIYVAVAAFTSGTVEVTDLTDTSRWALALQQPSAAFSSQTFSGDTMETDFTLSSEPASAAAAAVYVDGVRMIPVDEYTITGTTLAFGAAPGSGTDNILVVWATVGASSVADASVTAAKIAIDAVETAKIKDLNVTTGKLADDAVTLAKMEHGTQGDLLTYGASGAPSRLAKGTGLQVLRMNAGATAQEWANFSGVWQQISSDTFSTASSLDLGFTPASWRAVRIIITELTTSTTAALRLNATDDDFSTLIDSANNYRSSRWSISTSSTTVNGHVQPGATFMEISSNMINDGTVDGMADITLYAPNRDQIQSIRFETAHHVSGVGFTSSMGHGWIDAAGEGGTSINGIRLFPSAGTFTGKYRVIGLSE